MATESIASDEALLALLEQPDSRLRLALVPLFIRHPRLASSVAALVDQIEPKRVIELQTLYMAAVYLQRQWKTRLSLYLGAMTLLPDLFSQQMGLPAADVRYA